MTDRPILMSAPMVRAIQAGTKTQTRRVVKPLPVILNRSANAFEIDAAAMTDGRIMKLNRYGAPGDRLWVRETWGFNPDFPGQFGHICFRADPGHEHDGIKWVPSIHMPRKASRITLEVVSVRVERLSDICVADCIAEGIEGTRLENVQVWRDYKNHGKVFLSARDSYVSLWESINGPGSWDLNPWAWVVEFKRV